MNGEAIWVPEGLLSAILGEMGKRFKDFQIMSLLNVKDFRAKCFGYLWKIWTEVPQKNICSSFLHYKVTFYLA
jgi:hypothetical protein